MIILNKVVRLFLPRIASQIHYKALFELVTIEPAAWIKRYKKLSEKIAKQAIPPGSEIRNLCISKGFNTHQAQTLFVISELKRYLKQLMQLSPYKHL